MSKEKRISDSFENDEAKKLQKDSLEILLNNKKTRLEALQNALNSL